MRKIVFQIVVNYSSRQDVVNSKALTAIQRNFSIISTNEIQLKEKTLIISTNRLSFKEKNFNNFNKLTAIQKKDFHNFDKLTAI